MIIARIFNGLGGLGIIAFIIISIVLFIRDGAAAKREGRSRRVGIRVRFYISLYLIGFMLLFGWIFIKFTFGDMRLM
ncbi:MAG: hypothetical protein J6U23_05260 [Clostridiales bacterium]|nr:hypothetical protein [Clostridiales bacterium]